MHDGRVAFDTNTTAASHRILGYAGTRRRLTIFAPAVGTATISNDSPVVAGQGITLAAGQAPIYLDVDFHGACVYQEWYAIYTASGSGLSWIETLCSGNKTHDHSHDSSTPGRSYSTPIE